MSSSSNQGDHHGQVSYYMSENDANNLIKKFDKNGDSILTKDELTAMILAQEASHLKHGSAAHDKVKPPKKKPEPIAKAPISKSFKMKFDREQIREIFLEHDIDGDGYLTKSEVTKAFGSLGSMMPLHKANYALKLADTDGDGLIDEEELEKIIDYAYRVTNRN